MAGADPTKHIVRYFGSEDNAFTNTNPLPYTFENTVVDRQTIWVRVENTETGCFDIASFLLQIEEIVYAFRPSNTAFCNTDYSNDGVSIVDLTTLSAEIIGTQPLGPDLLVKYQHVNGSVDILTPTKCTGSGRRSNSGYCLQCKNPNLYCTAFVEFTIQLKDSPEVKPLVDGIICYEYRDSGQLVSGHYLDTGVPLELDYEFFWTRNGIMITANDADILEEDEEFCKRAVPIP